MRWGVALLLVLASRLAFADEVDDLEAKGQELAKQSEFTQAIAVFKQADAKRPRAAHACMIGLAYMRREAWPQAELFLALCEKRAVPGDQPPDWIDQAEQQLAQKLTAAQIPAVTITVSPANIGARLTVSSFAPDEVFDPQTIHLAPGKHVIEVTAPGYRTEHKDVIVEAGKPQTVTFELQRGDTMSQTAPPPQAHDHASRSKVPWIVGGAGVALGGIAVGYHLAVLSPAHDRVVQAQTPGAFAYYYPDWHSDRSIAIGLYAGAAVTVAAAVVLRYTVFKDPPEVTAQIDDHGGSVLVGWRR